MVCIQFYYRPISGRECALPIEWRLIESLRIADLAHSNGSARNCQRLLKCAQLACITDARRACAIADSCIHSVYSVAHCGFHLQIHTHIHQTCCPPYHCAPRWRRRRRRAIPGHPRRDPTHIYIRFVDPIKFISSVSRALYYYYIARVRSTRAFCFSGVYMLVHARALTTHTRTETIIADHYLSCPDQWLHIRSRSGPRDPRSPSRGFETCLARWQSVILLGLPFNVITCAAGLSHTPVYIFTICIYILACVVYIKRCAAISIESTSAPCIVWNFERNCNRIQVHTSHIPHTHTHELRVCVSIIAIDAYTTTCSPGV